MDPISAAAIATAASTAFNGWMSHKSQKNATASQMGLFNAQKAWEKEKMQNAYQWTMDDLEKAGLNATLMMGGGGSATTASAPSPSAVGTPTAQGDVSALIGALKMKKELEMMDAQKANIEADTANKEQQFELTPGITKAAIDLNNTQSAWNRAQKEKTLEEQINTNLRNHAQEIANRNADLDYNKRKAVYDKEMAAYIGELQVQLRQLGLKDSDIYTAINAAFETAGQLFRVVNVQGGNTHTTYKTNTINSPTVNY